MATKDSIKKDIDELPDSLLDPVDRFIKSLTRPPRNRKPLSGFKLGGYFDHISIRDNVYE